MPLLQPIPAAPQILADPPPAAPKDALVASLRQAKYLDLLPAYNGISYHDGPARLFDGGVQVGGKPIAADKIIITTGARPAVPAIPGIEAVPYLTSTTALELEELPTSLLIIGGGFIGAELAQMFARAGVRVTLVCRSRLLPRAEPEISAALTGYFGDEGINVVSDVAYRSRERGGRDAHGSARRRGSGAPGRSGASRCPGGRQTRKLSASRSAAFPLRRMVASW
jgi:pyruvate/2-oxoglutarate dehydrogenase complex dihydrolipoamide dehydrogenase (E3) component